MINNLYKNDLPYFIDLSITKTSFFLLPSLLLRVAFEFSIHLQPCLEKEFDNETFRITILLLKCHYANSHCANNNKTTIVIVNSLLKYFNILMYLIYLTY